MYPKNIHRFISHRGNLTGPLKSLENRPEYINRALKLEFMCEVDLWKIESQLWLGHDNPEYPISTDWLFHRCDSLYIHCKNSEALDFCYKENSNIGGLQFFWHQTDQYTFTSNGFIWAYPTSVILPEMIWACPEMAYGREAILDMLKLTIPESVILCTDYPQWYCDMLENTK